MVNDKKQVKLATNNQPLNPTQQRFLKWVTIIKVTVLVAGVVILVIIFKLKT